MIEIDLNVVEYVSNLKYNHRKTIHIAPNRTLRSFKVAMQCVYGKGQLVAKPLNIKQMKQNKGV